jgi:3',5'-cyclic AMP phosphodiesterase CpdA
MSIRIVHISDIHYDERDERVPKRLRDAIQAVEPDFIVCTGDLVSQPRSKNVAAAKEWLLGLAGACKVKSEKLLIIPGNHDYGFYGSLGISFLTGKPFKTAFKDKSSIRVAIFKEENLIFIHMDSNPTFLDLARGHVSSSSIRKLISELNAIPTGVLESATKIALIHHHCLPVYNESTGDRFLLLKNSSAVIEFFADYRINLVLHGHKHRATHSLLSIGGVGVKNRVIEVLAAGTAMKRNDYEDRGHNFNVISIDASGFRSVTQYFSKPVGSEFDSVGTSYDFSREYFDQLYEDNRVKQHYSVEGLHWDLRLTPEGDRFNEMVYTGFKSTQAMLTPPLYRPPAYTVETGSISGCHLDAARSSPGVQLHKDPRTDPKRLDFEVSFADPPRKDHSVNFVIQSWDLNASALTEEEFWIKHPDAKEPREYEEKEIDGAIENFTWQVSFPRGLAIEDVRFEVFDQTGVAKQQKLSEILRSSFVFSYTTNSAFLNLHKPPAGYRYRISWKIPQAVSPAVPIPLFARVESNTFKATALSFRKENPASPSDELVRLLAILETYKNAVADKVATDNSVPVAVIKLETSLMVYDDRSKPGKLRMVAGTLMEDPNAWNFALEIGDGNAGRVYKTNIMRLWPTETGKSAGVPFEWYIPIPESMQHKFLCSIPLRHPSDSHLIMGILNIGTSDETTSDACKCLNTEASGAWLISGAHNFVLTRLMEEFKI